MAYYGWDGYDGYYGYDFDDPYYQYGLDCGAYLDYGQPYPDEATILVNQLLQENQIVLFALTTCGPCKRTKAMLDKKGVPYMLLYLDTDPAISSHDFMNALEPLSGIRTAPQLFINGQFYGDSQMTKMGLQSGQIQQMCEVYGGQLSGDNARSIVEKLINENEVVLFAYTYCPPCKKTKALLEKKGIPYKVYNLDTDPNISQSQYADALEPLSGIRTVPQLFIHGRFYGDSTKTKAGIERGEIQRMVGTHGHSLSSNAHSTVLHLLQEHEVIMFATTICSYCKKAKAQLEAENIPYMVHYIDTDPEISKEEYQDALQSLSGIRTVPQLFIRGRFYGDSQRTIMGLRRGEVQRMCS